MLHSVLTHRGGSDIRVHYVHGTDIPEQDVEQLADMVHRAGGTADFVSIPDELIAGLPITQQHFNPAMWYRIHLPDFLADVGRVLYLDADTIALESLEPLWQTELDGCYVAAVANVFGPWDLDYPMRLGLPDPSHYFNSGVLLMDLDAMRRDDCSTALREYSLREGQRLWFCDQDAMNVLFQGRWLSLHPRWNCTSGLLIFPNSVDLFGARAVEEARERPAVRHFEGGGANKPWHYLCGHELRELYLEHRRQTPWPDLRLEGVTPGNVLRRFAREMRRRSGMRVGRSA